MSSINKKISIILVNWNTQRFLHQCLDSIYRNRPKASFEVFVVDNNSADDSVKMVKNNFPQVTLIRNTDNLGYSQANNQAIKASVGQYILVLNPDTIVLPGALDAMIKFMDCHPRVGIVGPQLLNPDRSLQPSGGKFPTLSRILLEMMLSLSSRVYSLTREAFEKRYIFGRTDFDYICEVDEVSGASLITRREVIDQVGLLDEDFFVYYEDVDWCYRIKQAGWKVFYLPQAKVVHQWRRSSEQIGTEAAIEHYKSRYLFFRKHYGKVPLFILKILTVCFLLIDTVKSWLRCIAGSKAKNKIQKNIGQNLQVIRMTF